MPQQLFPHPLNINHQQLISHLHLPHPSSSNIINNSPQNHQHHNHHHQQHIHQTPNPFISVANNNNNYNNINNNNNNTNTFATSQPQNLSDHFNQQHQQFQPKSVQLQQQPLFCYCGNCLTTSSHSTTAPTLILSRYTEINVCNSNRSNTDHCVTINNSNQSLDHYASVVNNNTHNNNTNVQAYPTPSALSSTNTTNPNSPFLQYQTINQLPSNAKETMVRLASQYSCIDSTYFYHFFLFFFSYFYYYFYFFFFFF